MKAAITGVGMSDIGRNTGRAAMLHLAEAADRALARAGLTRADIDGIATYPGKAEGSPGMSPRATSRLRDGKSTVARATLKMPCGSM